MNDQFMTLISRLMNDLLIAREDYEEPSYERPFDCKSRP